MKTKWYFFLLFVSLISISTLKSAAETLDKGRRGFKPGLQKPKRFKTSAAERRSPQRLSGSSSPLSQLSWRRSFHSTTLVTPSLRPGEAEARIQADFAYLPDVSVTCSTTDFVVRVKPAFYGLGADAQELTLGSSCKSNGVLGLQGDLLFTYPLTECDGARELPPGYLVYRYVLHYEPSPKRFPTNAQQISVNIECHYQRDHSVHQLAVQPTWQTVILRKKLKGRPMDFKLKLMDDSWTAHSKPQVYLLGQTVNVQVSAPHLPPGFKLYINSCYATTSRASKSSLKYTIIDNFGCMVDSKHDPGASQFVSRTDGAIKFSFRAFQFTVHPETEVRIHCRLSVTSEGPGRVHKSCTYQGHRWRALHGWDSVCDCCESTCANSKPQKVLMEGFASSGPLQVSDQPYAAERHIQPVSLSAISREREAENLNYYTNMKSHQKLWESLDVEKYRKYKEQLKESDDFAVTRESVLSEEKILEESEAKNLNIWKNGSGDKDFSEHPEVEDRSEESEHEISEERRIRENQKRDDSLRPRLQLEQMVPSEAGLHAELEAAVSKEDGEKPRACKRDKDRRRMLPKIQAKTVSSPTDDEETWYFTWT